MPVYKDNASNRKKGRVGKSYGQAVRPEMVARISALASKRSPAQKAEGRGSAPPPPVAASKGSSFTIIRPTPAPRRKAPVAAPRRKAVAGARTTSSTKGGPVARPRPASSLKKKAAPAKARKTFMNSTTSAEFDRMKKDFPIGIQVLRLNYRVITVAQQKKIGWYEGTSGELRASTIPDGWKVSAHTATGITIKKNDMKLNIPWKRADNWTYHSY